MYSAPSLARIDPRQQAKVAETDLTLTAIGLRTGGENRHPATSKPHTLPQGFLVYIPHAPFGFQPPHKSSVLHP
ncbi:hypothetical protein M8818_006540 [Zalaria obscura]|uniref:Uncharacterized protein n=1 Tax=Zalaria obscura TaxID=2024903 RepID=A0ACC3S7W9_9PEZI